MTIFAYNTPRLITKRLLCGGLVIMSMLSAAQAAQPEQAKQPFMDAAQRVDKVALTADEILQLAERLRGAGLDGLVLNVTLTNGKLQDNGELSSAEPQVMRVSAKGRNSLVEFLEPRKLRGRKILMVGKNMWFAAKTLSKPVPISARQRLLGQAANGDIASTDYASDYLPKLLDIRECQQGQCYVLELTANTGNAAYKRIEYWINTRTMQGIRADFFATSGKLFKTAEFEYKNQLTIGGITYPFVSRITLIDAIQTKLRTVLDYASPEQTQLSERLFDLRRLSR